MLLNNAKEKWDIETITEYCQMINGIDLGQGISSLSIPEEVRLGACNETASKQFIQKAKIATIPGRIFFTSVIGQKYIRVCFAKSVHRLREILCR